MGGAGGAGGGQGGVEGVGGGGEGGEGYVLRVEIDDKVIRRRMPRPISEGEHTGLTFHEAIMRPPGARDVRARLTDLDAEGIWGEVVYPSLTMWNNLIVDPSGPGLSTDANTVQNVTVVATQ